MSLNYLKSSVILISIDCIIEWLKFLSRFIESTSHIQHNQYIIYKMIENHMNFMPIHYLVINKVDTQLTH